MIVFDEKFELSMEMKQETGYFVILGRDKQGRRFPIARVTNQGLVLMGHIPADTGWPLDSKGRLQILNWDIQPVT